MKQKMKPKAIKDNKDYKKKYNFMLRMIREAKVLRGEI